MKKKIYKTYVKQSFNAIHKETYKKWFLYLDKLVEKRDSVTNFEHYMLVESKEEAIELYKNRYKWNDFEYVIDYDYGFWGFPKVNKENPDIKYEVCAYEVHPSINRLKEEMIADDFFEYCRQEMMPLEVVLCDKGVD
jgi:hypothetical protein